MITACAARFSMVSILLLLSICPSGATPPQGGLTFHADDPAYSFSFTPEQAKNQYIGNFVRWAVEDIGNIPNPEALLAVGSSSMRYWKTIEEDLAPLTIVHRGFGGSRMRDVVLFQDFFERYKPKRILVYEGDNDLAGHWTEVDRDFIRPSLRFIEYVREHLPETEIYFLSIKPSPARKNATERFEAANSWLRETAAGDPKLHYIDIYNPMLRPDGEVEPSLFKKDRLHMNEKGYKIWTEVVREALAL